ncbi:MAG: Bax inhibitor-1/YccA family protein [Planctomycetota bacterium]|nr:Bax inhibitor-1/YccA family protein [Planctomycetota bacterium]
MGNPAIVSFFNAVYAWMACGLAITGIVAWLVATHVDAMKQVFSGGMIIGIFIAQIVLVMVISSAVHRINATMATVLFLLYSALMGLTLSAIFLVYTLSSIFGAFAACAVMFGAMSVYGMVTKKDLSNLGRIMFMGLIGLIVASIVNIFLHSSMMQWLISYAGVVVFVGLTAYDTQRLKEMAVALQNDAAMSARMSINGALTLYLDFINLFMMLLRILGDRRN